MKTIKFAKNWNNKLACPVFTTIREVKNGEWTDRNYYPNQVGTAFNMVISQNVVCVAKLINARIMPFKDIPPEVLLTDTGKPDLEGAKATFNMFYRDLNPNKEFAILVFKKVSDFKPGGA